MKKKSNQIKLMSEQNVKELEAENSLLNELTFICGLVDELTIQIANNQHHGVAIDELEKKLYGYNELFCEKLVQYQGGDLNTLKSEANFRYSANVNNLLEQLKRV